MATLSPMVMIKTALMLPPKAVLFVIMSYYLFLSGCGGGGGGTSPPLSLDTTAATITPASISFLYEDFPQFAGAENRAFTVDVATGQVTTFTDDASVRRFLNKQPDPLANGLYPSDVDDVYVGFSHLTHQLGQNNVPAQISLGDVNQSDAGQYFLFGRAGPAPVEDMNFIMQSRYFCSHCRTNFGTASGQLRFDSHGNSAELTLANDEVALAIPFALDGPPALDTAISFHKDGTAQPITAFESVMEFFGPDAQNAGVLFSIYQQDGHLSGAAVGHRE